jgi:hypothetical protein
VRFQVFATTSMKMIAFLNVGSCSLVDIYRRFRGVYRPVDGGSTHLWRRRSAPTTALHPRNLPGRLFGAENVIFLSDSPCFPGDHSFMFMTPFIIL